MVTKSEEKYTKHRRHHSCRRLVHPVTLRSLKSTSLISPRARVSEYHAETRWDIRVILLKVDDGSPMNIAVRLLRRVIGQRQYITIKEIKHALSKVSHSEII